MHPSKLVLIGLLIASLSSSSRASLNDSLLVHYPLDGNANDVVGGNTGVVFGATPVADRFGNPGSAYLFDGVNDYIDTSFGDGRSYPNGVTISAWVRSNASGGGVAADGDIVTSRGPGSGSRSNLLSLQAGLQDGRPQMLSGRGSSSSFFSVASDTTINDNSWHHVLGTFDGNQMSVYRDGVGVSTPVSGVARSPEDFLIGRDNAWFDGVIDDVKIWDRALSAREAASLSLRSNASLPQSPRNEEPVVPDSNNLVLYTHGWRTSQDTWDNGIWKEMGDALRGAVDAGSWTVYGHDWTEQSCSLLTGPACALNNARVQGEALGKAIADREYDHVHLIAHSAGSNLISEASAIIREKSPTTEIHMTLLDPYAPPLGSYQARYGRDADWTENYSAADSEAPFFTYDKLPSAHNVDVSVFGLSHGSPVDFYVDTIGDPGNAAWGGYGYQRSREAGGWSTSTPANYPLGNDWLVLEGGPPGTAGTGAFRSYSTENIEDNPYLASDDVDVSETQINIGTLSPGWISIQLTTDDLVNAVTFDADFISDPGSEGLLAMYWNGELASTIDERYDTPGSEQYVMWLPRTMQPGIHELAFRLDPYTSVQSRVLLDNIQTGLARVPEPSTGALFLMTAMLGATRRRDR